MILNKANWVGYRRRGSIYITILGVALIVMVIGLSAVTLIRNIIGMDPQRGSLTIGEMLKEGQTVQFHLRD